VSAVVEPDSGRPSRRAHLQRHPVRPADAGAVPLRPPGRGPPVPLVLAGASIGAMASLRAAAEAQPQVGGVIWLAGVRAEEGYDFRAPDVAGLGCPTLFISADKDAHGAARDAREMYGWAPGQSDLLIVDSLATAPTSSPTAVHPPRRCARR
jgi:fermentation-respiration switch protein FrsA (DUF1100 family)